MEIKHRRLEKQLGEGHPLTRPWALLLVANLAGMSMTAVADSPPAPGAATPVTPGFEKSVVVRETPNKLLISRKWAA